MLARLVARLLLAPLGFVCGIAAAFATLTLISANRLGQVTLLPEDVILLGFDLSLNTVAVALLLAPLMGAPAIVAVLISEMFSIRSWTYHAAAGGACALMPWSLAPSGLDGPIFTTAQILAAGIVGGAVHWLVAGQGAGLAPPAPPKGPPGLDRR